ncbi:MAG TPA: FtsX-like permease family protein [Candidatus Dormibacteraeota bacterium]|nr:FtsX-like permease family protein [Candidatus Dormibacteraeota bacterium]
MSAVITKVVAELRRRRLQAALIGIIVVLASGTATIALTLIAESSHPYDRAFEDQRGAHLVAFFDARKATSALVAGTQQLLGASATGGPWPAVNVPFKHGSGKDTLTVVGRGDPGGRVEVLRVTAGRWVEAAGEIVLTRSFAEQNAIALGDQITALSVHSEPSFRVVGEAIDINEGPAGSWSQSAWVIPAQVDQLVIPGDAVDLKMAYRFESAPTADQIGRDITKLKMGLQPGAVTDTVSYLDVRDTFNRITAAILIFLLAFSVFALGAVALIIANVVTGAVIAGYREIGIMKAIGFTPLQVVQIFVAQMAGPALAGCLVGIPLGGLLSQPLLNQSADALGLPSGISFAPWIPIAAVGGVLLIVVVAAVIPAWRAAVLNPATAISLGTSPRIRGRSGFGRLLSRLGLARPISLGADDAWVRPVRGGLTAIAILLGVATLTFAYGLHGSFNAYHDFAPLQGQVIVERTALYPDASVIATLKSQPETGNVVRVDSRNVSVSGASASVQGTFYDGDSTRLGWLVLKGRWFSAPGEAVAASALLQELHLQLGDSFSGLIDSQPVRIRIVGITFDPDNAGHAFIADWSTLAAAAPSAGASTYYVALRPGTDPTAFARRIQATQPDFLNAQVANFGASSFGILESVMLALVLVLILIAIAGVFNTVLLNTRERIRDTAVLKAVGMTPGQILAMVAVSASVLGLVGGLLGVPVGWGLHRGLMGLMGNLIGNEMPSVALNVFNPIVLPLLVIAGLVLAILGAVMPARWAARLSVAEVLHAE